MRERRRVLQRRRRVLRLGRGGGGVVGSWTRSSSWRPGRRRLRTGRERSRGGGSIMTFRASAATFSHSRGRFSSSSSLLRTAATPGTPPRPAPCLAPCAADASPGTKASSATATAAAKGKGFSTRLWKSSSLPSWRPPSIGCSLPGGTHPRGLPAAAAAARAAARAARAWRGGIRPPPTTFCSRRWATWARCPRGRGAGTRRLPTSGAWTSPFTWGASKFWTSTRRWR
mmetsp:Transcript_2648/g.5863  ORF Transcript_2648/g.5863 Transcript_2648/m.5863 type:complete len:228 (+) Transcript_2648:2467-3150(+)